MNDEISKYKELMEGLLEIRTDVRVKTVRNGQGWPEVEMYAKFNELYESLNSEQKQVLSEILQEARDYAIFDTLEYIDDEINRANLRITKNDIMFPNSFFGGDFHSDWIALCQGDMWGEDRK